MEIVKKILKEVIPYIIILVVVLLIKAYIFTPVIVNGPSMMDTLHDKDIMILNKIGMKLNGIERFDIVVIQTEKSKIIKRVIGLPGETVKYEDDILYINGEVVEDPYGTDVTYDIKRIEVPEGEYYVLGDNRNDSVDSRILGTISEDDILGCADFIIYPFNRFGSK